MDSALKNAKEDLDAALNLAPAKSSLQLQLLLQAATDAQREAAIAAQRASREKATELWSNAGGYYEQAIDAFPSDPWAYLGLGELYQRRGDLDRAFGREDAANANYEQAVRIWRRGLKAVKTDEDCLFLNLALSEALIQQKRPMEAETVLKTVVASVDGFLAKLDRQRSSKVRFSLQHRIDQQNAAALFP